MGGRPIQMARKTLQLFLRSLPMDCTFNIVGFGCSFEPLFPQAVPYGEETLAKATEYAAKMEADFGGTELLRPLQWLLTERKDDDWVVTPTVPRTRLPAEALL